jgi:hypothetical protein
VVRRIKLFDYGSDSSKASVFWRLFSFLLRLGYTPRELLGNPNQKSLINGVIILLPGAFQISGCIAGGLVAARLTKRKHGGKTGEELKSEVNKLYRSYEEQN